MPARLGWSRWLGALLFGLLLLLLLLLTSWLLRACSPVDPSLNVATRKPRRPCAAPPPDPTPVLKASLDDAQSDGHKLKALLASLQADLKHKVDECKPIEPPKPPPPVAKALPPPPPPQQPPPQQQASAPPVNRRRPVCYPATGRAIPAARA